MVYKLIVAIVDLLPWCLIEYSFWAVDLFWLVRENKDPKERNHLPSTPSNSWFWQLANSLQVLNEFGSAQWNLLNSKWIRQALAQLPIHCKCSMNSAMLNLEISECGMFLILLESIASQKGKWAPVSLKHWSHGSMILYMNQLEATSFGNCASLNQA